MHEKLDSYSAITIHTRLAQHDTPIAKNTTRSVTPYLVFAISFVRLLQLDLAHCCFWTTHETPPESGLSQDCRRSNRWRCRWWSLAPSLEYRLRGVRNPCKECTERSEHQDWIKQALHPLVLETPFMLFGSTDSANQFIYDRRDFAATGTQCPEQTLESTQTTALIE